MEIDMLDRIVRLELRATSRRDAGRVEQVGKVGLGDA